MRHWIVLVLFVLTLFSMPTAAQSSTELAIQGIEGAKLSSFKPEVMFLRKTTTFKVPAHSEARLAAYQNYGGAKFAHYFARDMIKFFEANGYPNFRQMLEAGSTDQLDQIAARYSFEFVYEGPDDQKAWEMFANYSGLIHEELFHWGWMPKSGEAHIVSVTSPKVSSFSATSDGKAFKVSNPTLELPSSIWNTTVKPVFEKWGSTGNRI